MRSDSCGDDRAVSEILGFILVFSLMMGTITFVYIGGFAELDTARDAERINNAERAFDVLASNFDQLGRGDAPSRATEIKLSDAQLQFGAERQFAVNEEGGGFGSAGGPRSIVYSSSASDTEIVYEAGAVIRAQSDGAVMLREPDFVFGERATIRFISPRRSGTTSVSGDTTVLVRSTIRNSEVRYSWTDASVIEEDLEIFIDTSPDRAEVWKEYFESQENIAETEPCEISDEGADTARVTCDDLSFEAVTVARTTVTVEFT